MCEKNECCKVEKNNEDYLVCTCMEVMASYIKQAIKEGDDTLAKLSERLGVGTGCSSCIDEVEQILECEINKKHKN